jgi:hypothetical protein
MLKTSGHVKKYYRQCCVIFEAFKDRGTKDATLSEFMKAVEGHAKDIEKEKDRLIFKGDMLEILCEIFFKAFSNSPQVGLTNYTPVRLEEDYGVDGRGTNANGKECAVQIKYRANPLDSVNYAEIARTYSSAVLQMRIPLDGPDCIFVFTTANSVTPACTTVFGKMVRVLNKDIISQEINNNVSFWQLAFDEIKDTLIPKRSI